MNDFDITRKMLNVIRESKAKKTLLNEQEVNPSIKNVVLVGKLTDISLEFTMNYDTTIGLTVNTTAILKLEDSGVEELRKLNVFYKQWCDSWVKRLQEINSSETINIINKNEEGVASLENNEYEYIWNEDKQKFATVTDRVEFYQYTINP